MGGMIGGATSGAQAGSMFGPWGTVIGAGVGALAGSQEKSGGGPGAPPMVGSGPVGMPESAMNELEPATKYAPTNAPARFGMASPGNMDAQIREHMLRQLIG